MNKLASDRMEAPRAPESATGIAFPLLSTVVRAMVAGAVIAIAAGMYTKVASGGGWMFPAQSDQVSAAGRQQRLQAFSALGPMALRLVEPAEVSAAIDGMALPPEAKQTLLADVKGPLRLAWITLWDTDVQDGDVVRIDSEGYSRTVRLTKRGDVFAVPVPADGIITVTGIRDGDGGGITVGLASGAAQAVFPIMSSGQSLGLSVTIK